jgi:hypothetical protein
VVNQSITQSRGALQAVARFHAIDNARESAVSLRENVSILIEKDRNMSLETLQQQYEHIVMVFLHTG